MILRGKRWRRSNTDGVEVKDSAADVDIVAEIRIGHDGEPWLFLENGPTGYESMPITKWKGHGWMACMGCANYDALWIPSDEMSRAFDLMNVARDVLFRKPTTTGATTMDDLSRFDNEATPTSAGNFKGSLEQVADGDYNWTILTAMFDHTKTQSKQILRLEVRCEELGKVVEKVYFFESQDNVNVLLGDLGTLGFDVGDWTPAKGRPFSQEIHKAIPKLPGIRFRGTKKTNAGKSGGKTYHNLYVNAKLADASPEEMARPSTNGAAAAHSDPIPF